MTYIIAWKEFDHVYCVGDSAITGLGETTTSSFGELSYSFPDGNVVEEKGMKIVPIADKLAVYFSGNVFYANKFISRLREVVNNQQNYDVEKIVRSVASSCRVPKFYSLHLLFLWCNPQNEPKIISWKSENPTMFSDIPTGISIGSLSPQIRNIAHKQLEYLVTRARMTPESAFHCMIVILQQLGTSYLLMGQGVGGAFFGANIGPNGFAWQKDITYVLYPPSLITNAQHNEQVRNSGVGELRNTQLDVITCMVRDNAWITHSPYNKGVKIISRTDLTQLTAQQLIEKWDKPLRQNADVFDSDYYAFIGKIGNDVTIIKTENKPIDNKFFSVTRLGRKEFEFFLRAELLNHFAGAPEISHPNQRSTNFSFLVP